MDDEILQQDPEIEARWRKLTGKQQSLIRNFFSNGRNKFQAYCSAYERQAKNSGKNTLSAHSHAAFKHPKIEWMVRAIDARAAKQAGMSLGDLVDKRSKELKAYRDQVSDALIDSTWTLVRAAALADFNIRKFVRKAEDGGFVYDFSEATETDWYCIQSLELSQYYIGEDPLPVDKIKFKSADKIKSLELVAKLIGAFDTGKKETEESSVVKTITRRIIRD